MLKNFQLQNADLTEFRTVKTLFHILDFFLELVQEENSLQFHGLGAAAVVTTM